MSVLYLNRTACMTAVTVKKVRTACVLQCPRMYMPVQQQEYTSVAGEKQSVVSTPSWNMVLLESRGRVDDDQPFPICSTGKFSKSCPAETVYGYNMTSCGRTCRSLTQADYSCLVSVASVDGCGCAEGAYMNEEGQCVSSASCPCYDKDSLIPAGQAIIKDGITW